MKGLRFCLICFMVVTIFSCGNTRNNVRRMLPRDSFMKVEKTLTVTACNPRNPKQCVTKKFGATASGSVVSNLAESAYVLTAGHVCVDKKARTLFHKFSHTMKFEVLDIDYRRYAVEIIALDLQNDLCMLYVRGLTRPALLIESSKPKPGDRVYNIAAPLGIFSKQMVPIFEGFYDGDMGEEAIFTIPAKGGSSGSPIMNHRGALVGMVSKAFTYFTHLAISPSFESVNNFVHAAVEQDKRKRVPNAFIQNLLLLITNKKVAKNP